MIFTLTSFFLYYEAKNTIEETEKIALLSARTISFMPAVEQKDTLDTSINSIQAILQKIGDRIDADYVLINYEDGPNFYYPATNNIKSDFYNKENYTAIIFGGYYVVETEYQGEKIVWGKAPILSPENNGEIIGVVSVGFLKENIHQKIVERIKEILHIALIITVIGIFAGILFSRRVRDELLGYEPDEISSLFKERDAILKSIREGIIATDQEGRITLVNNSAKLLLNITDSTIGKPIGSIFPENISHFFLKNFETDREIHLNGRILIVNNMPIIDNNKFIGSVSSFRDKTEIKRLFETITEIRQYYDEIRAQTHEYTNKLYVISGLLQLKYYDKAIELIQKETKKINTQNHILFKQIKDINVQAILLGKIGKASEKKVKLVIDENSSLSQLPEHIEISDLVIILGNLIDNAIEVVPQNTGKIIFFTTDIGNDIIFEITDNGKGISDEEISLIFKKGVTSKKGKSRGYGLFNVKEVVEKLNGSIEVNVNKNHGTTFSVFLPKKI